jgi:hypothetical protein
MSKENLVANLKGMWEDLKNVVVDTEVDVNAFIEKGNKSAGTRVRGALLTIKKKIQEIRTVIQDIKKS